MTFSLGSTVGTIAEEQKNARPSLTLLRTSEPCIRYSVPKSSDGQAMVRIDLYNLNGALINTLVNENKQSGQNYTVALNNIGTGGLKPPRGTYLCTLNAAGGSKSIKIVVK
jgi:hypothetical protein